MSEEEIQIPTKSRTRQPLKTKISHITPKEKQLIILREEARKHREELKAIRAKLAKPRKKAEKKEYAARRIEQVLSGNITNTPTHNLVFQDELDSIPKEVADNIEANIIFRPNPGPQTDFLAATETEVLYGGARGGGKFSSYNTNIVTPFGYRKMGDLKVGDTISNPDGSPQQVIQIHEQGVVPLYRIHFMDGSSTLVGLEHLWLVHKSCRTSKLKNYNSGFFKGDIQTTEEIKNWLDKKANASNESTIKNQNLIIPLCNPIQFTKPSKIDHKTIHPYTLGCLLGDGCITTSNNITLTSIDFDLIDRVRDLGYIINSYTDGKTHRFLAENEIVSKLEKLKLLGTKSNNKFIPECYKWASVEDRFELIKGLMDTDGTADKRGHLSYTTISKTLAEDVRWVLKSLGAKVTVAEKYPTFTYLGEKKVGQLAYTLYIQSDHNEKFFWLPRKIKRCVNKNYNGGHGDLGLRITKIEYEKDEQARCITVRNPNGLYMQDDFIVTHNSYSLLVDPLRYCHKASHRAVLIRRTMPELRDLINHSRQLYSKAFPGAKFFEQSKEWRFPSGARIEFGYLENNNDLMQFQGQAYTWIGIDEIGQFADYGIIKELLGSLRSVDPTIPTYFRCSANPGGLGSHWIKEHFIDPAPPNTAFYVPVDFDDPDSDTISRKFIPARLYDNPYLTQTKAYENMLKSLPEIKRKQWLEGRWDVIEGAAFEEFNPKLHVISSFTLPSNWPRFRSCDWGFSSPYCVLWYAVDYEGTVYVYREMYGKGLTADIFAQRVRQIELGENIQYGVMDSSVWSRRGDVGPPVPEIMRQNGCLWRPSDRSPGSRHSGKMEIHRRLRVFQDENGNNNSRLKIFSNCRNLIRTLPALPLDSNDNEDVDTKAEDHAYDSLRYGLMSRPMDANKFDFYQDLHRQDNWSPASSKVGY